MIILDSGNSDKDSELGNRHTHYTHRRHWELEDLTGVDERIWKMLVKYGILDGNEYEGHTEQAQAIATRLNAARNAKKGRGITAKEAAGKYGFSRNTFYGWIKRGWVRSTGEYEDRSRLMDEGDVAFARELVDICRDAGSLHGRSVFPERERPGRPRKSKNTDQTT